MHNRRSLSFAVTLALAGCGAKLPSSLGTAPRLAGEAPPAAVGSDGSDGVSVGSDGVSVGSDGVSVGSDDGGGRSRNTDQELDAEVARARVDPERGNCTPQGLVIARQQGLSGPCWDPPGSTEFAAPVHVVPGMRAIADGVYWFDIPREATLDPNNNTALLPSVGGHTFPYEPYSGEGGRPPPALPRVVGLTVDEALAALDRLDAPLSVELVTWSASASCNQPVGRVCQQNFDPTYADVNLIVVGE